MMGKARAGPGRIGQGVASREKVVQGRYRNKTEWGGAEPVRDRTGQNRAGRGRNGQERTGADRNGQERTGTGWTGQGVAERSGAVKEQGKMGLGGREWVREERTGEGRVGWGGAYVAGRGASHALGNRRLKETWSRFRRRVRPLRLSVAQCSDRPLPARRP